MIDPRTFLKLLGLALWLGLFPALPGLALADQAQVAGCGPQTALPDSEVMNGLFDFLARETDYDIDTLRADPPEIAFCDTGEHVPYEGQDLIVDEDLRAAYDARARRIYLVRPWNPRDPKALSTLLHELAHAAQTERAWPCIQSMEWEAYHLQARWLAEQGLDHGFDWFTIWRLSRCPHDMHP